MKDKIKVIYMGKRIDYIETDPKMIRHSRLDRERRRLDLANLAILIRQYPDKAQEFLQRYAKVV